MEGSAKMMIGVGQRGTGLARAAPPRGSRGAGAGREARGGVGRARAAQGAPAPRQTPPD
jgi:hypothetical protein